MLLRQVTAATILTTYMLAVAWVAPTRDATLHAWFNDARSHIARFPADVIAACGMACAFTCAAVLLAPALSERASRVPRFPKMFIALTVMLGCALGPLDSTLAPAPAPFGTVAGCVGVAMLAVLTARLVCGCTGPEANAVALAGLGLMIVLITEWSGARAPARASTGLIGMTLCTVALHLEALDHLLDAWLTPRARALLRKCERVALVRVLG